MCCTGVIRMRELLCSRDRMRVLFVLCERCYWTASLIEPKRPVFSKCPACYGPRMAFIPITQDESYSYEVSEKGGLELRFSTRPRGSHAA